MPLPLAVNVVDGIPQLNARPLLLVIDAPGNAFIAAMPLPGRLEHPPTVCVTVKVPGLIEVIKDEVAPLLQSNAPVKLPAVNTELPQLLATDTVGAGGISFGAAVPPRVSMRGLVQPFMV